MADLLRAYTRGEGEQQVEDAIMRFGLDRLNPADVAAAIAYRWAQGRGPWWFDTPLTGPAMAERVMRGVRADPTLLGRALSGDRASMAALAAVAQRQVEYARLCGPS